MKTWNYKNGSQLVFYDYFLLFAPRIIISFRRQTHKKKKKFTFISSVLSFCPDFFSSSAATVRAYVTLRTHEGRFTTRMHLAEQKKLRWYHILGEKIINFTSCCMTYVLTHTFCRHMMIIFYDSGLTHRVTLEILTKSASPSRNRTEQKYWISHGKKEKRSKKLKKIRKENIWNDYWINSISFVISVRLPSPSALCVYLHKMNFPSESSLSVSSHYLLLSVSKWLQYTYYWLAPHCENGKLLECAEYEKIKHDISRSWSFCLCNK